jgi:hypothetical protein
MKTKNSITASLLVKPVRTVHPGRQMLHQTMLPEKNATCSFLAKPIPFQACFDIPRCNILIRAICNKAFINPLRKWQAAKTGVPKISTQI